MVSDLFITFLLILFNGFFVAAEFALVKVRASQLDLKVKNGSSRAKLARSLILKLDAYLSATQLGITLASLALGAIGEEVISQVVIKIFSSTGLVTNLVTVHSISLPIALTLLTFLHVTLGEQIPKMIGIKYSMSAILLFAWPLRIFYFICSPFIWLLNNTSNVVLRIIGVKKSGEEGVHTEEELRLILTESEEGGAIKPSENELIQNVFDFDDRIVKQIMVPQNRVVALDVELGRGEITKRVIEEGFSRIPIYLGDIDNIIGIVHSKDLLKALIENKFRTLKDIMRPVHFIPESMKINSLLRDFQKHHIQMAIVTNEFGSTAGLITMEDIIEELVGEIQDEHDEEKPNVEKKSETEYIVNAQATIDDVNDALPIALPENSHYETVSGYINYIFGRIPAVNDKRKKDGYELTILKRTRQSVDTVRLKVLEENEE
ncbi:MAG: hemolysin family protein [Bacteroidota bacterium]|nr:hemolysin family protein [Bacteroidota bacterium]MDP3145173.1 hemolysin family protein [Bacteroidota bacterium]MDP3557301.1 hemolysin family protein [Bacteroidota bacterium]